MGEKQANAHTLGIPNTTKIETTGVVTTRKGTGCCSVITRVVQVVARWLLSYPRWDNSTLGI